MRRLEIVLFVFGLSFLAYLYGVASTKRAWFPTPIVEDGLRAAKALKEVWDSGGDSPPGAIEAVAAAPIHRRPSEVAQTRASNPQNDLLLMTGGPFMLMDFCPPLGCLAWLMDRSGTIYHTWPIDPTVQWGETLSGFPEPENINPVGTHVYDNGDLLVTFQGRNTFPFGVGIAKFDKEGKLLWKKEINAHHWFDIDDNGLIYLAAHRLIDSPLDLGTADQQLIICEDDKIYEDFIVILDPAGEVVEEFSLLSAHLDSGYAGLLERTRGECDPLHLNDVRVLKTEDAEAYPGFAAGDLLVSTNSINAVAILDRDSRRIKWLTSGMMIAQHNPRFGGDGRILVFDNGGGTRTDGKGGSRIIEIDTASEGFRTIFPKPDSPPSLDFYTRVAGHFDLDRARSRALVTLSLQGRLLEVDLKTGDVLWDYVNIQDIGDYLQSNGQDASSPYALFGLHSSYYVGRPAFLE